MLFNILQGLKTNQFFNFWATRRLQKIPLFSHHDWKEATAVRVAKAGGIHKLYTFFLEKQFFHKYSTYFEINLKSVVRITNKPKDSKQIRSRFSKSSINVQLF